MHGNKSEYVLKLIANSLVPNISTAPNDNVAYMVAIIRSGGSVSKR